MVAGETGASDVKEAILFDLIQRRGLIMRDWHCDISDGFCV